MSSVLLTGAARAIGRATALELARRAHRVIATSRDPRPLAELPVDMRLKLDVAWSKARCFGSHTIPGWAHRAVKATVVSQTRARSWA